MYFQKQPPLFLKVHKFHMKTPVLESLFERIAGYGFFLKMMKLY